MKSLDSLKMALRVLVADDEPIAREYICGLVAGIEGLELIGSAKNGEEALEIATTQQPHIALLDIRMPKLQGTTVARKLAPFCRVIFTTAYERYAVDAFSIGAVDYLLKPFGRERFAQAINRAARHIDVLEEGRGDFDPVGTGMRERQTPPHFYVKDGGSVHRVEIERLIYVQGSGDYVVVRTEAARHFTRTRLSAFERFLPSEKFIRIHRSTIVNLTQAEKIAILPNGRVSLHLKNGEELRASRMGARKLKDIFSSNIAIESAPADAGSV